MRRIVLILVCGLALLGVVGLTMGTAGAATATSTYTNYHYKTYAVCNDCHTMHGTLQHDYAGGATSAYSGNTTRLLKLTAVSTTPVTDLCLTCHDGNGVSYPDVKGASSGGQLGPRSAGAIPTGAVGYENWKGHNVEVASATAPGGTAIAPFKCTSCHATHGSSNYRNLWNTDATAVGSKNFTGLTITPGIVATVPNSSFSGNTEDVVIYAAGGTRPAYGTGSFYQGSNVYYLSKAGANNYSNWCGGCHTSFVSTAPTGSGKHPTGVNIQAGTTSSLTQFTNAGTKVPVLATTFTAGVPTTATAPQVFCQSCHQAHGNQNPFMLLYVVSGTPFDENGGSTTAGTTGTCQVCHTQGT